MLRALLCAALFASPASSALVVPGFAESAPLAAPVSLPAAPSALGVLSSPAAVLGLAPLPSAPAASLPEPAAEPAALPAAAVPLAAVPAVVPKRFSSARALLFLMAAALGPKSPLPPVETFLRENQNYVQTSRRASLADGAVVAPADPRSKRPPYRVSYSHAGLRDLFARVDAAKAAGLDEAGTLAAVRDAVKAAIPRRPDAVLRASQRRAALSRKTFELGAVAEAGRGSDEDFALLANLALQRAGFKPKLARVSARRRDGAAIVDEDRTVNLIHTAAGQVVFDAAGSALDGGKISELTELDGPRVFTPEGKPKTSGVEAKVSGAKELSFAVTGRSAAERLFKDEEKSYQAAAPDQKVTVEWLYFPFYVDGHTGLRVGESLYEFGRKGWRTHNARAFLFNNPFFEAQMARHSDLAMPPFSFGTPLTVPKADIEKFLARVRELQAADAHGFSFWFNNCNQVFFRFLKKAGVALSGGAYTSFSSIRAYRELLLHPPEGAGPPRIYPLPNQNGSSEPLGAAVPRYLVENHSAVWDAAFFVRHWPKFIGEKIPHRAAPPPPKG